MADAVAAFKAGQGGGEKAAGGRGGGGGRGAGRGPHEVDRAAPRLEQEEVVDMVNAVGCEICRGERF